MTYLLLFSFPKARVKMLTSRACCSLGGGTVLSPIKKRDTPVGTMSEHEKRFFPDRPAGDDSPAEWGDKTVPPPRKRTPDTPKYPK
jgi:hypothetical protein